MGSAPASRNISKPVNTAITYRSNGKVYTQSASEVIAQRDSVASSVKQTVSQSVNSPISPRAKAQVSRGNLNTKVETLSKAFTPVKGSLANKVKGVCDTEKKQKNSFIDDVLQSASKAIGSAVDKTITAFEKTAKFVDDNLNVITTSLIILSTMALTVAVTAATFGVAPVLFTTLLGTTATLSLTGSGIATAAAGIGFVSGVLGVVGGLAQLGTGLVGKKLTGESLNNQEQTERILQGIVNISSAGTSMYLNQQVYNENVNNQGIYRISKYIVNEKESNNKSFYHYTSNKGMDGILKSNKLLPSLKSNNPNDSRYGDGQYLSDINPDETTPIKLSKTFINVPNKYKYTNYIKIDTDGLNVVKGREGVYVVPNNVPLDLTDRIKGWGSVE